MWCNWWWLQAHRGCDEQDGTREHAECKGSQHARQRIAGKDAPEYVECTGRAVCVGAWWSSCCRSSNSVPDGAQGGILPKT